LFGVKFADRLASMTHSQLGDVSAKAGLTPKYAVELRKMVKLAKYVAVRE
jgi:hypothetical protein